MPPAEERRVVVWRLGDALLAAPLAVAVEVAPVGPDGKARTRTGPLELRTPPGLPAPGRSPRAMVLRVGDELVAMAADDVEGVKSYTADRAASLPPWLRALPAGHLAGLVRVDDGRIAALLAIETLVDT